MAKSAVTNLAQNSGIKWFHKDRGNLHIRVKGFAFQGEICLKGEKLLSALTPKVEITDTDNIISYAKNIIQGLNGSFAVVIETDGHIFAAVDRLRSIPLFYGTADNKLFLSDDTNWVRKQVADTCMDEIATKEFLLTGYVTGSETLFPNVKQLQAGECLWVEKCDGKPHVTTHRYYRYIHQNFFNSSEEDLYPLMDQVLVNVFERLLESTKGRTLVIPLSGGLDSRLIVAMLKKLGRENVICFSYGRKGHWESEISKKVAERLGYKWEFVRYTRRKWYEWFQSDERRNYYKYADGLSSLAHIQDWPAVWELKKMGKIPDGSVFVPGHSGDFVAGSHIPQNFVSMQHIGKDEVDKAILGKHYSLWDWSKQSGKLGPIFKKKILSNLPEMLINTPEEAANAFECWDWQERQAKFIVNSCRAYEFWGYDWRIPLWDSEMMDFWARVPLELRLGKKLYDQFLEKCFFTYVNVDFRKDKGKTQFELQKYLPDQLIRLLRKRNKIPGYHLLMQRKIMRNDILVLTEYLYRKQSSYRRNSRNPCLDENMKWRNAMSLLTNEALDISLNEYEIEMREE